MINFYNKKRVFAENDISIKLSTPKSERVFARVSICNDAKRQYFKDSEYFEVGTDVEHPNRLYFAPSTREMGYKLTASSTNRWAVILGKDLAQLLAPFVGEYKLHKDGDNCYIER